MTIEGLGKKFQEARTERKLTLDEAARMTKIRPSRLAEIEADDFSQFPSLAYAKGFLIIYGKFLDVDVTPYMEAFEGSDAVTVDGYSYLQDNPAPKPARTTVVPRRPVASSSSGKPMSLMPVILAVVVVVLGYMAMKLILNIQRIAPSRDEQKQVVQASAPPSYTPASTIAPAPPVPTATPAPKVVAASPTATSAPKTVAASPTATSAPKAVAASPTATSAPKTVAASPTATSAPKTVAAAPTTAPSVAPSASAKPATAAAAAPSATTTAAEPEVRRAQPVLPEDLIPSNAAAGSGPNLMTIRPLKKTYIKVVVDNDTSKPAFERWISPTDKPVEFRGQHFSVRVLDREAVQIKKNGKSVTADDSDVTIE